MTLWGVPVDPVAVIVMVLVPDGVAKAPAGLPHATNPDATNSSATASQVFLNRNEDFRRRTPIHSASERPGRIPSACHGPLTGTASADSFTGVACCVKMLSATVDVVEQPVLVSVAGLNTHEA